MTPSVLQVLITRAGFLLCVMLSPLTMAQDTATIGVGDAALSASFYSDASCLLSIGAFVQPGKTVIDADVDETGSRMLIHCDTEDGRRLTLLARGDSLNLEQRTPLLNREQIAEGEYGMIAWLTRSGVHYTDDAAPRRYVIGGSVKLRNSPSIDTAGTALNSSRQSFGTIDGVLEPIVKTDSVLNLQTPVKSSDTVDSESAAGRYIDLPDNLSARSGQLGDAIIQPTAD